MAFTDDDARDLFAGFTSLLLALGKFDQVNSHEPLNAPGKGLNVSVTLGDITTAPSGLAATSLQVNFIARIYSSLLQRPLDPVDPALLGAVVAVMSAYAGQFTLSEFASPGLVRSIGLLAATARPAYLMQDGKEFRVAEVTMPVIINDVSDQEA